MNAVGIAVVLPIVILLAAWLMRPGRSAAAVAPPVEDDGEAREAREELDALYESMAELEEEVARGELDPAARDRLRDRYEARAARLLGRTRRIEPLAVPRHGAGRRVSLASSLALLAGLSLAVAAVSGFALPRVANQTVTANDPRVLAAGREILELERRARTAPTEQNLLALARKAWDWQAYDKAASAYLRVVEGNPRQPEALRRFGILLFGSGRYDEALAALTSAVRLDPSVPEAYQYLGQALYQGKQDAAGAVKAWLVYRRLAGDNADPQVLALLEAAQAELAAPAGAATTAEAGAASRRALGARVYATSCAACHGAAGAGGSDGPGLRRRVTTTQDERVFSSIVRGGRGRMPAVELTDAELGAVFEYVRSLGVER